MAIIHVKRDYATIQAAVDAAEPGDEILVEDGVFHEQVTISKNFIKITGGKKTILDGTMNLDTGIILNNTSGVEITSIIIKNYRSDGIDILGSGIMNLITKTQIEKINYYGIFLDSTTTSNKIIGCSILGAYSGIYDLGSNLSLEDSKMLYCSRGFSSELSAKHTRIDRCLFYKNSSGILLYSIGSQITKNRLHKNRGVGIVSYASCLIEDNKITETYLLSGIQIGAQYYGETRPCTVRRNWVCSSGTQGIRVETGNNHTIVENEVYDSQQEGILILTEGNTIVGNKAERNGKYDIARVRVINIICDNECGKSLPPWICGKEPCLSVCEAPAVDCNTAPIRVPTDYSSIQAAVDAAEPGDVILVESGVYYEQVTINKSYIKILGGKMTVLDGNMMLNTGIILSGTNGVEIKSMIIKNYRSDGIDILGNGSDNVISNICIFNINYSGILLGENTSCNWIKKSVIEGNYNGIEDRSSSSSIDECKLCWNGNYGVYISGNNTTINQSVVTNNYNTGITSSGSGVKIAACTISHNGYHGIELADNSVAEENEVSDNLRHGITLIGNKSIAKNNRSFLNNEYGIYAGNLSSVIGNSVNDNKLYGMVASTSCHIEGNTAHGNKLYDLVRNNPGDCIIQKNDCGKSLPPWLCKPFSQNEEEFVKREPYCEQVLASIRVPDDYPTIQAAVDAAFSGDVILVRNGIYHEEVVINKSYLKIIGEDKAILDGETKLDNGISVNDANGVKIISLILKNFRNYGIGILNSNESNISNICILSSYYGISLERDATNTVINGCSIAGGVHGIFNSSINLYMENCWIAYNSSSGVVSNSDQFCIRHTYVCNNLGNGINCQKRGGRHIISDCIVNENRYTCIVANGSSLIKGNKVYGNYSGGIHTPDINSIVEENVVYSNVGSGISVYSTIAIIRNNVYDNEGGGIHLNEYQNFVEGNTAQNNGQYDMLGYRANNIFKNNICDKSLPPWICCNDIKKSPLS